MIQLLRLIYAPFVTLAMIANTMGAFVIFLLVATLNIDVVAIGRFTNACKRGRARHTEHAEVIPNPVNNRDGGR